MDLLQQLGITKEEVLDRIVSSALGMTADYRQTGEESWEDIPLSKVVDKKITTILGDLVETMKPKVQERIEKIMDGKIEEVFNLPFQPVDRFGNPQGEKKTIRELIADESRDYWEKMVDESGKPNSNNYSGKKHDSRRISRTRCNERVL